MNRKERDRPAVTVEIHVHLDRTALHAPDRRTLDHIRAAGGPPPSGRDRSVVPVHFPIDRRTAQQIALAIYERGRAYA